MESVFQSCLMRLFLATCSIGLLFSAVYLLTSDMEIMIVSTIFFSF